jgi:hypothetical protein
MKKELIKGIYCPIITKNLLILRCFLIQDGSRQKYFNPITRNRHKMENPVIAKLYKFD